MTTKAVLTFVVGPEEEGARLDSILGRRPEIGSRSQVAASIQAGLVTVDGVERPKSHRPGLGQTISAVVTL